MRIGFNIQFQPTLATDKHTDRQTTIVILRKFMDAYNRFQICCQISLKNNISFQILCPILNQLIV